LEILSDLEIEVYDSVYVPSHDTFLLIELLELNGNERVLEIGCGSGFVSLHCASKGCRTTAVDISKKAVENTLSNASKNDLEIEVKTSDMFSGLSDRWDVIIFNPPYLPEEMDLPPDVRWDGGKSGDETILYFLSEAYNYLKNGGEIYMIYSDRAPLEKINNKIDERYVVLKKISETFSFETIYAVKLSTKFY